MSTHSLLRFWVLCCCCCGTSFLTQVLEVRSDGGIHCAAHCNHFADYVPAKRTCLTFVRAGAAEFIVGTRDKHDINEPSETNLANLLVIGQSTVPALIECVVCPALFWFTTSAAPPKAFWAPAPAFWLMSPAYSA